MLGYGNLKIKPAVWSLHVVPGAILRAMGGLQENFNVEHVHFTNQHNHPMPNRVYLPENAFDTHVHVFDPKVGPYAAGRAYTPEDAPLEKLITFNKSLLKDETKNTALVIVQPSPYKNDCSVMMHSLQEMKYRGINAFGIAVLDLGNTTNTQLNQLHAIGIRGIRLNFQTDGKEINITKLVDALHYTADRIRCLPGWMIQLFVPGWTWDPLHDVILGLPVRIIADHLGGMLGPSKLSPELNSTPTSQSGFNSLLLLAKQSRVCVKVSGLYRVSNDSSSTYSDLQPIVQTFAKEIPDHIIWGSDWPHTGDGHDRVGTPSDIKESFRIVDNHSILRKLQDWMGNGVYKKMLVDNPGSLYLDWHKTNKGRI